MRGIRKQLLKTKGADVLSSRKNAEKPQRGSNNLPPPARLDVWRLTTEWNLYFAKSSVKRTIFFTLVTVKYMEKNLDITKPRYSKQILPVISRFHCKKLKVFCILTHWKPLELWKRYLTYAIGMTKHLERTILMKMADIYIDTNSPSSLCRFAWQLGVQVLDFTIYFLQLL